MTAALRYAPSSCALCGSAAAHCDLDHDFVRPEALRPTLPVPPPPPPAESRLLKLGKNCVDLMRAEDRAELFGYLAERMGER